MGTPCRAPSTEGPKETGHCSIPFFVGVVLQVTTIPGSAFSYKVEC